MNQINKYLNHITWILNALKEHHKIINQELKFRMSEKPFINNKNFQAYYYNFTMYMKLENNLEKGYRLILSNNKINKKAIITLKATYLNRCALNFKTAGNYLKMSRQEMQVSSSLFSVFFVEMKNIASLLMNLESDINFLIMNLF